MKLCVLGFDALDSQLFESSRLYWLKWLRERGQWGTLYSEEMRTAPCWTTIFTSLTIEHHKISHILGYPYEQSLFYNGRSRDYMWDYLYDSGYSVGVVNVPGVLFAREIGNIKSDKSSWTIGGWPARPNVYPHNLDLPPDYFSDLPDFEDRQLSYLRPKGAQKDFSIHEWSWEEYIEWAGLNAFKRMEIIESYPEVECLILQESVLDRAFHMLSTPSKGRLGTEDLRYQEVLKLINSIIGYVVENYKPEYLSIVSDHGAEGLSEADPQRGCWHSHRGTWAIVGPDITRTRNNTNQVNYTPTILDALGIDIKRDGQSVLIKNDEEAIRKKLEGLGYM